MGTSTRRTNNRVNKILNANNKSSNDININKLVSDILFPKRNSSKIKNDIVNSTCSPSFTQTVKRIITLSNNISNNGIGILGINNYANLLYHEQVEFISSEICYDEEWEKDVRNLVSVQVERIFTYSIYEQIVININDELKTGNALRDISNFILKELKI